MPHIGDRKQLESSSASCSRSPAEQGWQSRATSILLPTNCRKEGQILLNSSLNPDFGDCHSRPISVAIPDVKAHPFCQRTEQDHLFLILNQAWEGGGTRISQSEIHHILVSRSLWAERSPATLPHTELGIKEVQKEHFPPLLLELPHSNQHKKGHRVVGRRNSACLTLTQDHFCVLPNDYFTKQLSQCVGLPLTFLAPSQFLKSFVVQWLSHNPWKNTGWAWVRCRILGSPGTGRSHLAPWSLFPEQSSVYSF